MFTALLCYTPADESSMMSRQWWVIFYSVDSLMPHLHLICSPDTSCIHLYPLSSSTCILYWWQNCRHGDMYPLVSTSRTLFRTLYPSACRRIQVAHPGYLYPAPPILHLASSEQWCWSGGRGILTELSLWYSLVFCSISAMYIAQS